MNGFTSITLVELKTTLRMRMIESITRRLFRLKAVCSVLACLHYGVREPVLRSWFKRKKKIGAHYD